MSAVNRGEVVTDQVAPRECPKCRQERLNRHTAMASEIGAWSGELLWRCAIHGVFYDKDLRDGFHYLKTEQPWFEEVWNGVKTFEVRKNDRGFLAGDVLCLQEYDRSTDTYSGRRVTAGIGYLFDLGQIGAQGFVVMALLGPMHYPRDAVPLARVLSSANGGNEPRPLGAGPTHG